MQNREDQVVTFKERLLHDALRNVFVYLTPSDITLLLISASVNPASKTIMLGDDKYYSRNGEFWREKLHTHFPEILSNLIKKERVDWYAEFKNAYQMHYKSLTKDERRLFTLVKEGDVKGLEEQFASPGIKFEAAIKIKDKDGRSILDWVCLHRKASRFLLNFFYKQAELELAEHPEAKEMMKPLHYADLLVLVKEGDAAGLEKRLASSNMKLEVVFNINDKDSGSILDWVCQHPMVSTSRLLLNVFYKQAELEYAEHLEIKEMMKPLHRADLLLLVKEGDVAGLEKRLAGANIMLEDIMDIEEKKHKSIFDCAYENVRARRELLDCFYQFAELECEKHPENNKLMRLIHWAAMFDQSRAVIKSLAAKNPKEIDSVSLAGGTALHIAAQKGFLRVAKTLMACGADLGKGDARLGRTPLYMAAANGKIKIVRLMLDKASLEVINKAGRGGQAKTPLQVAIDNKHKKVACLIEKKLKEDSVLNPANEGSIRMNR